LKTINEKAEAYQSRSINSFKDIPKSDFEEMETLYNLGGVELINKVMGLELTDFRYGIPIPNINPGFKGIDKLAEEFRPIPKTPVENLMELLKIENDCSYETYEDRIQEQFNFSKLLGDEDYWNSNEGVELLKNELELNLPISYLHDPKYMKKVRENFELNLSMPGCLGKNLKEEINFKNLRIKVDFWKI
jgi:hypothetical protein